MTQLDDGVNFILDLKQSGLDFFFHEMQIFFHMKRGVFNEQQPTLFTS